MIRTSFVALLLIAAACRSGRERGGTIDRGAPATATTVVLGTNVVDVGAGRVLEGRSVVIRGNRITEVRPAGTFIPPSGARIIDGRGKYLIPGLWDMHTHVTMFGPSALSLFLANGVTGIRDMGAERTAAARGMRDSIAAGLLLGPRMRVASPIVENVRWLAFAKRNGKAAGTPWTLYERFGPNTPEEAERWVDSVAKLRIDHIKVRNWPAANIGAALVARAQAKGIPVVGHANEPFPRSGVATYEHGIWPIFKGTDAQRDSVWRVLAASGAAFDPTLVTWPIRLSAADSLIQRLDRGQLPGLEYVPKATRTEWRNQLRELAQERPFDWAAVYRATVRDAAELAAAGVPILAGTDIGAPLLLPGISLLDETELLARDARLGAAGALRAAITNPARVLGMSDVVGRIAPGYLADMVLLDANPLDDIRQLRQIAVVFANGRVLDRSALDHLLLGAIAAAQKQ